MATRESSGYRVAQDLEALGAELGAELGHAGEIAAGPRQAVDKAGSDRIARAGDDDRYVLGRLLGGERRRIAERDDDVDVLGLELGHKPIEPFGVRLGGSEHENEVFSLGETARSERGDKRHAPRIERVHRRAVGEQPQPIGLARLLRARSARPGSGGGEQGDEVAAPHALRSQHVSCHSQQRHGPTAARADDLQQREPSAERGRGLRGRAELF